jgi:hypothetical protein
VTPERRARLAELQNIPWRGRTDRETEELEQLRIELAKEPAERADDPKTLLTDEARRPMLDGGDFLELEKQRCCSDALAFGEQLAIKFGTAFAEVALEAALTAIKKR